MSARVRMFACVTIGRAVAAKCNATGLAGPQMYPRGANLDALDALTNFGLLYGIDGIQVRAGAIAHLRLRLFEAVNRRWIPAMAIPPSPTADAQRFTDPDRTSPAAKIPGRLVSIGVG